MFASIENYESWKGNPLINWISIPPDADDLAERQRIINGDKPAEIQAPSKPLEEPAKLIEDKTV